MLLEPFGISCAADAPNTFPCSVFQFSPTDGDAVAKVVPALLFVADALSAFLYFSHGVSQPCKVVTTNNITALSGLPCIFRRNQLYTCRVFGIQPEQSK